MENGKELLETDQSIAACLKAVKEDYRAIRLIDNQADDICIAALNNSWLAIQHIKNKSDRVCKHAIDTDLRALQYIESPSKDVKFHAIDSTFNITAYSVIMLSRSITSDVDCLKKILERNPELLKEIKKDDQTEDICIAAIKLNWENLRHAKIRTPKIYALALSLNSKALQWVPADMQTEEIINSAIENQNPEETGVLKYVRNQTEAICLKAVDKNWRDIEFAKIRTETVCMKAYDSNILALRFLSPEVGFPKGISPDRVLKEDGNEYHQIKKWDIERALTYRLTLERITSEKNQSNQDVQPKKSRRDIF